MRRGKPQQQIYRPGSGPLRKSNVGIEESESDTNIIINSRQTQSKPQVSIDDLRHKSEGCSPRDKVTDIDSTTSRLGDVSLNKDITKRQKKPEQMIYVPRPLAQAREYNSSQDINRNSFSQTNGGEMVDDYGDRFNNSTNDNRSKRFLDKKREHEYTDEWREKSQSVYRPRQGSEPRGSSGGPSSNWQRTRERDTRSVEPSGPSNRNYNSEKIQSKPPSGRRHSIGVDDKRHKHNIDNLPPRLKKKLLGESSAMPEETWDGNSLTFQGQSAHQSNFKNPSFHQAGATYNTLPGNQNFHNQNVTNIGYYTVPAKPQLEVHVTPVHQHPPLSKFADNRSQTPVMIDNFGKTEPRPFTGEDVRRDGGYQSNRGFDYQRKDRGYENRRQNNFNRDASGRDRRNNNTESRRQDNRRDKEGPRETPSRDNRRDRETPNKNSNRWDRETPNRDNRKEGQKERRKDNRRDSSRRSRSRDFNRRGSDSAAVQSRQDEWSESRHEDKNGVFIVKSGIRHSLENQLSPVSPETPEEKIVTIDLQAVRTTLDWSEEVELNAKLEAEALSDALTRSSSVTSLQEISSRSMPTTVNNTSQSAKKLRRREGEAGTEIDHVMEALPTLKIVLGKTLPPALTVKTISKHHKIIIDLEEEEIHLKEVMNASTVVQETLVETAVGIDTMVPPIQYKIGEKKSLEMCHRLVQIVLNIQKHEKLLDIKEAFFDHNNPSKPIIVKSNDSRVAVPGFSDNSESTPPQICTMDQYGNVRPGWYDENSEEFKMCQFSDLLRDVKRADTELQFIINSGGLLGHWSVVEKLRQFLKEALEYLLCKSMKFCQSANVEQHFWKILYHNIIEVTRNAISNDMKGQSILRGLLSLLEESYNFKLGEFLGPNSMLSHKGLGLVGLALISAQKLFLFLGDLGRYREQVNETSNYGKCRLWYIKSHEINPKNGRPYNQLAILAVLAGCKHYKDIDVDTIIASDKFIAALYSAKEQVPLDKLWYKCYRFTAYKSSSNMDTIPPTNRRKLDAVYYYMRSLMSSNPVPSAKENLISLFDENRKKVSQNAVFLIIMFKLV
ncbi:hypothetical protein NQ317_012368 [Molorchus minor]|uniref:DNA/RNA-binding domain-containing protein n=1 Tax=Molorchus minor TaxID=1323400 RepID=A0ABQ9JGT8_9CUCU|nr:hypothetical protein NQ317_012368 [Molorchus minor]